MPPGVPATWLVPDVALPRLLADAVRDFPDIVALSRRGGPDLTHVQYAGLVDRLALGLAARGVGRVILVDPRPVATVLLAQAAWRLGIPLVVGPQVATAVEASLRADERVADEPASDERVADEPAFDEPAGALPIGEPWGDEPASASSAFEHPATRDVAVDGAVVDGAVVDGASAGNLDADAPSDRAIDDSDDVVSVSIGLSDWSVERDIVVGSRRRLHDLRVPTKCMLVDDLLRIPVDGDTGLARVRGGARRLARRFSRRDRTSLTGLLEHTTQGALPAAAPQAVAVVHVADGVCRAFTHANLMAATFQARLWIPDLAAGTERVAAAMDLRDPVALVLGPLLSVLSGANLRCDVDPATTIAGATIAFGKVAVWQAIAKRHGRHRLQRGDGSPSTLRVGGVVTSSRDDLLAAADVRAVMAHTEGARLRHFWTTPAAAGPVAAQPVYGRVHGTLGAEALTNTTIDELGTRVRASGPQFAALDRGRDGWTDVTGMVPPTPAASSPKDAP